MLSGLDNPIHLLIIGVVVLLLFGARRLPEMGRALGSGMREFKDGVLGREPSGPSQDVLEPPAESADRTRHGNPVG
jgi:sec-independent protein translocase protein TatA